MLLTESENARILRQLVLDIVTGLVNRKTGSGTKYINQRSKYSVSIYSQEENYCKEFSNTFVIILI